MATSRTVTQANLTDEAATRVAMKFCRLLGMGLGVIRLGPHSADTPTVLNAPLFGALTMDAKILLGRKWTEQELLEKIYQAYRQKRKGVTKVSDLMTGLVAAQSKKDPNRNLMEMGVPRRWHPLLATRTMPRVSFSRLGTGAVASVIERPSSTSPMRTVYTLDDLRQYWETSLNGCRLKEAGETLVGALSWTTEHNDLSDILWSIDALAKMQSAETTDKTISVFDLDPYLKDQELESRNATQWLNQ